MQTPVHNEPGMKAMNGNRFAPPNAAAMMEALRGLGYSTATALADVIDNSLAAGATEVHVRFEWRGVNSRVSILDNGVGMTDPELESAMTLGSRNPRDKRAASDLGRFGLGLKTASFSQCRKLTVASRKKGGVLACLRWDLDAIERDPKGGWNLLEGAEPEAASTISLLDEQASGTLVLWQGLDRIVTADMTYDDFVKVILDAEARLAMVFHRLLEGESPAFRILVNDRPLKPWDPFMMDHPAKPWQSPVQRRVVGGATLEVQCHVLPHKDMLKPEELDRAAGPEGWVSQQGFYVYRNRRLLVAGGWLGLGKGRAWHREEAHKLARIRVDIPNSVDADWKIDVRKSMAHPPIAIRPWLTNLAEDTRERARRTFAYRGSYKTSQGGEPVSSVWVRRDLRNGVCYRVDETHPAVAAVLAACGERSDLVKAMIRVLEETVPVQRIWLDTVENRETPKMGFASLAADAPEGVTDILKTLYADMTERIGMTPDVAIETLLRKEPFNQYAELVRSLPALLNTSTVEEKDE